MFTCRESGPGVSREPFRPASGDRVFQGMGHTLRIKVSARETRGRCAVMEYEAEPGASLLPHVHHREDVILFVLRGEFTVTVGEETRSVAPGDFVFVPRGVVRAWRCVETATGESSSFQIIVTPGGLEEMFMEMDTGRRDSSAETIAASAADAAGSFYALLGDIAARYDITFLRPEAVAADSSA